MPITTAQTDAVDYESVTVAAVAIGLTDAKIKPAAGLQRIRALITVETAQIRYRYDGEDPTASEGHLAEIAASITIHGARNLENFRAIRTGGTSGTLRVTYHA